MGYSTQMLSYNQLNFILFQDRQKGLGVDGCPWFYVLEGRGGSSNLPVGIISFVSPSNEGLLSLKISFKIHEWMEVEVSSNLKFFKLYLRRRREAKSWGNIGAFRSVGSQLTSKIFQALDHTGGVHNASVTWSWLVPLDSL